MEKFNPRLKRLRAVLKDKNIPALFVANERNVRYLTGFSGGDSFLLITPQKNIFLTDPRYLLQSGIQFKTAGWQIRQHHGDLALAISEVLAKLNIRSLRLSSREISLELYLKLRQRLKGIRIKTCEPLIEAMREIKDPGELALIRRAVVLARQTLAYAREILTPGISEKTMQNKLEHYMRSRGAEKSAFEIIVASGKNSAMPHAPVSEKKIKTGEPVIIDLGCVYQGYNSDLTRTFVLGKISSTFKRYYHLVQRAQEAAIKRLQAGVTIAEIDCAARKIIQQAGMGKYFQHSVGHGIGLNVHERPALSPKNKQPLQEGMIATIEPAVYVPGWGGIRIEDMVLITKKGCEVLSR